MRIEAYRKSPAYKQKLKDGVESRRKEFGIVLFKAKKIVKKISGKTFNIKRSNVLIWRGHRINFGIDGLGQNYAYVHAFRKLMTFKKRAFQSDRMATINYLEKSKKEFRDHFGLYSNDIEILTEEEKYENSRD